METVSVVIATYNRAEKLFETVKSIIAQTYPIREIIIGSDGCTDHSQELMQSFSEKQVYWIECGRNGRPAIARNKGLQIASGKWVAITDDDDIWRSDKIELQMKAISDTTQSAVCSNAYRIVEGKMGALFFNGKDDFFSFENFLKDNPVICSSVLFERKLLENVIGFPEDEKLKGIEDYALWMRIACCTQFVYLNAPLLNYSDVPQESIRKNNVNFLIQRERVFKDFLKWTSSQKQFKTEKKIVLQELRNQHISNVKSRIKRLFEL